MLQFAILGLHRSGTNYLARTMDLNFRKSTKLKFVTGNGAPHDDGSRNVTPDENKDISKHLYGMESHDIPVYNYVLIHKSPYQWIDSVRSNPLDFGSFYPKAAAFDIVEMCKIYNEFHMYWNNMSRFRNVRIVKYEELLTNTAELLDGIKNHWSLDQKFESYNMPTNVHNSAKHFDQEHWDRQFYTELHWDDIEIVNENINRSIMRTLRYDYIEDPSDRRYKRKHGIPVERQSTSQLSFDF